MKLYKLFLAILLLTLGSNLFAQKDSVNPGIDSTVTIMTSLLQKKILLSNSQTQEISGEIINWLNNKKDLEVKSVLNKIEDLLDLHQKSKFQIIKDEWWGNLIQKINSIGNAKKLNGK